MRVAPEETGFPAGLTGTPQEGTPPAPVGEPDEQPTEDTASQGADVDPTRSFGAKLLAGKYKTPEDLERAYTELQGKLGEMGNELGQYRQAMAQAQQPQYDEADLEDFVARDPRQAVQFALNTGNDLLYRRAVEAIAAEDQFAAIDLHARRVASEMMQAAVLPLQQQTFERNIADAWNSVKARHPGLTDDAIAGAFQTLPPALLNELQSGTRQAMDSVLETAFHVANSMGLVQQGENPVAPAPQAPGPSPQEAGLAQRVAAQVAQANQLAPQGQSVDPATQAFHDMWDRGAS